MAQHGLMDVDLAEQVSSLRQELAALKKAVGRRSSDFYENAGDTFSDYLSDVSQRIVPGFRRQARAVERAAYDHPAAVATVGLLIIALMAGLVLGARSSDESAESLVKRARQAAGRRS
ncbi:hypothetical protein SAZ10_09630 [Mesorhizobium sp. BAC0120]|uniref:hypothetical protein n=1 Tax=Mesorhizobium sp. BAC0120 TaxID=3090670 RepID=UPI00298D1124|nr:hypothetical protein [Mesorhizobium sp. BAC0120]MDW6022021.1 hypothetical protein [Mesorhizobium sp. BAC0120]